MKQYPSNVSDREADASLRTLVTGPVVRATDIAPNGDPSESPSREPSGSPRADSLPPTALRLLRTVVEKPMLRSSEYAKLAGMSPNTVGKARPILIEKNLVREHKLESGKRGRAAILLEPLEAARKLLAETGAVSS